MGVIFDAKDVSLWREHAHILDSITWRIKAGERWALLGPNGSGKTSLLQIVAGTLWPSQGRVSFMNRPLGEVERAELTRGIGWVTQGLHTRMPPRESLLEVVISGAFATIGLWEMPSAEHKTRAKRLLEVIGLSRLLERPFGVLSHGEKQRAVIARALMANPKMLILDEPCAGLDMVSRAGFMEQIEELCEALGDELTLVMATHHVEELSSMFDHSMVLAHGRVAASGATADVLHSAVLSQAFGCPISVEREGSMYSARVEMP